MDIVKWPAPLLLCHGQQESLSAARRRLTCCDEGNWIVACEMFRGESADISSGPSAFKKSRLIRNQASV
jgi:hypothetical protein